MTRPADLYAAVRAGFLDRVASTDPTTPVPATPGWDVRTVVAHLVGLNEDLVRGNVADYAGPDWTSAQVASRAGRSLVELVGEWDTVLPAFLDVLADPVAHGLDEFLGIAPVVDLVAHDLDLQEALGLDVTVDPETWAVIGPRRRFLLDMQVQVAGLPALAVRTPEGDDWTVGAGAVVGSVAAPRLDLWRSLEGRRSQAVVQAFDWTVDPGPYLPVWPASAFRWPET